MAPIFCKVVWSVLKTHYLPKGALPFFSKSMKKNCQNFMKISHFLHFFHHWRQPIGFNRGKKKLTVVIDDHDHDHTTTNRTDVPLTILH